MFRLRHLAQGLRRPYSASAAPTPREELARVAELQAALHGVGAHKGRKSTIARYADLRRLLEFVYHPKMRLHFTSARIDRPLSSADKVGATEGAGSSSDPPVPSSLIELFEMLSARRVTGSAANRLVSGFLCEHGVQGEQLETFKQLVDRNLVAGFRSRMLNGVPWPECSASAQHSSPSSSTVDPTDPAHVVPPSSPRMSPSGPTRSSEFNVALGVPLSSRYDVVGKLASRKYDGVRVIAIVDFADARVHAVKFLSRTGNEFTSLARLEGALRLLKAEDLPEMEKYQVETLEGPEFPVTAADGLPGPSAALHRLVLDGEVCVLSKDGTEDFSASVSQVRRYATMEEPRYLVFDALTWGEFSSTRGSRLLSDRLSDVSAVATALGSDLVRAIKQERIRDDAHLASLVSEASDRGWEGLILRKDTGYRGRRTRDIRKIKSWADAEFTVLSRVVGRIALAGRVQDACTSLTIEHRGHPVSVGSGLSTAQRLRFVDESAIVGKQVTVQYFEETEKSLRFPTVKRVWEDGPRDM